MAAVMLTTIDNPFNPFEEWDEWNRYDRDHGYHSCGLLARIAKVSDELSEADYNQAIEHAINEIILYDPTCKFMKVYEDNKNITDRGEGV